MRPLNQNIQNQNYKKDYYEEFLNRLKKINNDLDEVKETLPKKINFSTRLRIPMLENKLTLFENGSTVWL
ncbi:hypothetical protein ADICYQ_5811 [Cyclobacterium qasimii M12-11B]|uniref:Uncharacterized protein n=1 Tax=Cyclobacterium qasimii M12-11B TaxID=641524 RepID=S7WM64_9BACT|nr:hypothetical protein ADICYQ_5811 [Cyclobacterium qasimii M12-11B]